MKFMAISFLLLLSITSVLALDCSFPGENFGAVILEEIPLNYTNSQLSFLNNLFSEVWILIKGSAQMSELEFCELNSKFADVTNEEKEVSDLMFRDIWNLTRGSAQMSEKEFNELKNKYYLDQNSEETAQEKTEEKNIEKENKGMEKPTISLIIEESAISTNQEIKNLNEEKIVLNSKLNGEKTKKEFLSKSGKTRLGIFYGFIIFLVIVVILLALRKL